MKLCSMSVVLIGAFFLFFGFAEAEDETPMAAKAAWAWHWSCADYNRAPDSTASAIMVYWIQGKVGTLDRIRYSKFKEKTVSTVDNIDLFSSLRDYCSINKKSIMTVAGSDIYFNLLGELESKKTNHDEKALSSNSRLLSFGLNKCSYFIKHRKDGYGFLVLLWMQGAVEGADEANFMSSHQTLFSKLNKRKILNDMFEKICIANPESPIMDASYQVYSKISDDVNKDVIK